MLGAVDKTDRGFEIVEFEDSYGKACVLQQSRWQIRRHRRKRYEVVRVFCVRRAPGDRQGRARIAALSGVLGGSGRRVS